MQWTTLVKKIKSIIAESKYIKLIIKNIFRKKIIQNRFKQIANMIAENRLMKKLLQIWLHKIDYMKSIKGKESYWSIGEESLMVMPSRDGLEKEKWKSGPECEIEMHCRRISVIFICNLSHKSHAHQWLRGIGRFNYLCLVHWKLLISINENYARPCPVPASGKIFDSHPQSATR